MDMQDWFRRAGDKAPGYVVGCAVIVVVILTCC